VGIAVWIGAWPMFMAPLAVFATVNWVHIPFEEAKMRRQFGAAYDDYVARVRRWVAQSAQIHEAARAIGLPLQIVKAANEHDLDAAFSSLAQLKVGGLVMTADALFTDRQHQIVPLAKRYGVPTIYEFRHYVMAGGLFSYGPDPNDSYRQTGNLVGRILKARSPPIFPSCSRASSSWSLT
jgi:ABC-type uncharacterized transport system substrate-binding protein